VVLPCDSNEREREKTVEQGNKASVKAKCTQELCVSMAITDITLPLCTHAHNDKYQVLHAMCVYHKASLG